MSDETAATTAETTATATTEQASTESLLAANETAESAMNTQETNANEQTEEAAKAALPPDKYEFKMPEGVTLDEGMAAQFDPIARKLNLSNEQAQELVDLYAAQRSQDAQAFQAKQAEQINGWKQSVLADKEIGGDNLKPSLASAQSVLKRFVPNDDEFKSLMGDLDSSGFGNHPGIIKLLARIGSAMGEDTSLKNGKPAGSQQVSAAKVLFPNLK